MQRVVTAVVLGTLIVAAVVMLPTGWLAAILGGIVAVAAWEWCTLARIKNSVLRVCYTVTIAALMVVLYDFGRVQTTQLLILAFAWWCLAWCWDICSAAASHRRCYACPVEYCTVGFADLAGRVGRGCRITPAGRFGGVRSVVIDVGDLGR